MRKITIILFSVFFILLLNTNVHAQLIKLGVGGGLTQVLGPNSYTDDIGNDGLGFSSEYNYGAVAKVDLPLIPITPRGFFLYHKLNSNSEIIENSQSISSLGLGIQISIIPIPAGFDPYISLDATYNDFGEFKGINPTGPNSPEPLLSIPNGSRLGLQLGVGTEVTIIPMINVDVFAGYNWFNLTGKEDGEETISAFVLDVFLMLNFL